MGQGQLAKGTVVKALLLSNTSSGGGLNPEPFGYPSRIAKQLQPASASGNLPGSTVVTQSHPSAPLQARPCRVGVIAVGEEGASAISEVTAAVSSCQGAAREHSSLVQVAVPAEAQRVHQAGATWSGDSGNADACDIVLVVGTFSLNASDTVIVEAVRGLLDKDAPGICDAILRAGLRRTPLMMLAQLVAGIRNST